MLAIGATLHALDELSSSFIQSSVPQLPTAVSLGRCSPEWVVKWASEAVDLPHKISDLRVS